MKCDKDFLPDSFSLWTANIQHGLFRRKTAIARSLDGVQWNVIGFGRHSGEPDKTVWWQLVDRYFAMKAADVVSWATPRK